MARYIDADKLKEEILAKWYTCEEIEETIDQQPSADVKPVVRICICTDPLSGSYDPGCTGPDHGGNIWLIKE